MDGLWCLENSASIRVCSHPVVRAKQPNSWAGFKKGRAWGLKRTRSQKESWSGHLCVKKEVGKKDGLEAQKFFGKLSSAHFGLGGKNRG